jgi:hypothetical protein
LELRLSKNNHNPFIFYFGWKIKDFNITDVVNHFASSIFLCASTALIARSFVSQTPQHEKLYPLHHNTVFEFGQYKGMTLDQIAQENASYILWCTRNIKKKLISRQPLNISYDYYAQSNFSRTPKAHLQLLCAVCTLARLNALGMF